MDTHTLKSHEPFPKSMTLAGLLEGVKVIVPDLKGCLRGLNIGSGVQADITPSFLTFYLLFLALLKNILL